MTVNVDLQGGDLAVMAFTIGSINSTRLVDEAKLSFGVSNLPAGLRTALKGQVVSQEMLRPFGRARKKIEDYLYTRALKSDFGFVINPRKVTEVVEFVDGVQQEVDTYVEKFINDFDKEAARIDEEIREEYADFPHIDAVISGIQDVRPTEPYLRKQLGMRVAFAQVGMMKDMDESVIDLVQSGQNRIRSGLWGQLLGKVTDHNRKKLNELDERRSKGNTAVIQKSVNAARECITMLSNLSFVDGRVSKVQACLEEAFSTLPSTGKLVGREAESYRNILVAASDEAHILWCLDNDQPLLKVTLDVQAEAEAEAEAEEVNQPEKQESMTFGFSF